MDFEDDSIIPWDSSPSQHIRTIIHIDIDCFYAQVEMIRDPSLQDKPLGIQQKTIVVTCNYKARSFGVQKLMLIKDAIAKCPDLVLVNGEDLTNYRKMSYEITSLIQKFTPLVERLGMDENYIDITELIHEYKNKPMQCIEGSIFKPSESISEQDDQDCDCGCHKNILYGSVIAKEIREAMFTKFGITSSAGIAHNKFLSKLVGSVHKPNQQTSLFPKYTMALLDTIKSVRKIPGIGTAMEKKLSEKSIASLKDLQDCSLLTITTLLGRETAEKIKKMSFGIDDCPVIPSGKPQSHGIESAFKNGCSYKDCEDKIKNMVQKLLERVLEDGRLPQTIRLTIRKKPDWQRESKQTTMPQEPIKKLFNGNMTAAHCSVVSIVMELFKKLVNTENSNLTLIGITFTKLEENTLKDGHTIQSYFSKPSSQKNNTPKRFSSQNDTPNNCIIKNSSASPKTPKRPKMEGCSNILTKFCQIPPNVDQKVFKELPVELQKELIQSWYSERLKKN